MKNKIALILLLILVILLTILSIFLGCKFLNNKNALSNMTSQTEELNTQITKLSEENIELNNKIEALSKLEEEENEEKSNSINVKTYYNNDNTITLYLLENNNLQKVKNSKQSGSDKAYVIIYRDSAALFDIKSGLYYIQDNKLKLNVLNHNTNTSLVHSFNVEVEENEKNGTTHMIGTYDGDKILLGTQTLIEK